MHLRFLLIGLVLASRALAAAPELEFIGVISGSGQTKLAFRDPATGVSRWLNIGQSISGYTVSSYDPKDETAVLTKDNATTRIRLSTAKVESVALADVPAPPAIGRPVLNNLRQIAAAADQYYLENGRNSVTLADLVGPTKYIRQLNPVDGEDYGVLQIHQGSVFTVRTASGYAVTYDPNPGTHRIQAGDTLATIAQRNGISVQRLIELNQSVDGSRLRVGQVLRLK